MKRLAVLISNAGSGTNLQAIIDVIKNKTLSAKIVVVISSDLDAFGLERARKNNIPTEICNKKNLLTVLKKYNPDYICLAGWKQIILDEVIDAFPKRILNLHPGLIPNAIGGFVRNPDKTNALWNRGKLTDVAIKNFLDNNASYAGSSIHCLSYRFDFGKVLGRTFEKIKRSDDVESLYKRLKKKENKLYVEVLGKLCN
ncbi:MAG: hypothetical protein US51_C0011G0007 [Microgenomates group bacterium GW2011_GWA2_37_6]|nr:MAG: hypothetical protein US51_C0011G0007 [Microgenomates group bacterium GW2011_GWA2_37_6]